MTNNQESFELAKQQYDQYSKDFSQNLDEVIEDPDLYQHYQQKLVPIVARMENNFPNNPEARDSWYMINIYSNIASDNLTDQMAKKWFSHTKNFLTKTKKENIKLKDTTLTTIMHYLHKLKLSSYELSKYYSSTYPQISSQYSSKDKYLIFVEKHAQSAYCELQTNIGKQDKKKQLSSYKKMAEILLSLPAHTRYPNCIDIIKNVRPLMTDTEYGRITTFPLWQKQLKTKVWKSLPFNIKQYYQKTADNNRFNNK